MTNLCVWSKRWKGSGWRTRANEPSSRKKRTRGLWEDKQRIEPKTDRAVEEREEGLVIGQERKKSVDRVRNMWKKTYERRSGRRKVPSRGWRGEEDLKGQRGGVRAKVSVLKECSARGLEKSNGSRGESCSSLPLKLKWKAHATKCTILSVHKLTNYTKIKI